MQGIGLGNGASGGGVMRNFDQDFMKVINDDKSDDVVT